MTRILAFDPSGNFHEGKGTTGFCVLHEDGDIRLGEIRATDESNMCSYWERHVYEIDLIMPNVVVIEGYRLYNHRGMGASTQANSDLETPQLIGVLKYHCYENVIPYTIQYANEVKTRWSDKVLVAKGILIEKNGRFLLADGSSTNRHQRDALRHALHYKKYGGKKK